jgi:hypothetical protein
MERFTRRKPSPAMVVALISLFVSLSGVAWAANTVDSSDVVDNSLLSRDLKDNEAVKTADVVNDTTTGGGLTAPDLRAGSVGTSEVVNDSLTGADIAESTLGIVPNANQLDGKDSTAFATNLWAVAGFGTPTVSNPTGWQLFRSHGATATTRLQSGEFAVTFNRNITGCAYVASGGDTADGGTPPQFASVRQRNATSNPNDVVVNTYTSGSTTFSDPGLGDGFHLAVFC